MKRLLIMVFALILPIGLFAGGQSEGAGEGGGPVEIEFSYWANTTQNEDYMAIAKSFEEKYPQYKVKLNQHASTEEFWNALPIAISAQAAPDVIAYTDEGASEYIATGVVHPLGELIESSGFEKDAIIDSLWKGWTYQGELYGIPRDAATSMLFINKDYFRAAGLESYPETMEELAAAAKALTTDDVYGLCINLHEFHITQYLHAYGGDWNFGAGIDSQAAEKALNFIVDLYRAGAAVTPSVLGASWDGEVFAQGKAAISTGGAWYIGFLRDAAPDLDYAIIPIPVGTVPSQSAFSGGYSILSQSKQKEGAMLFIKHALSEECQRGTMNRMGNAPARAALLPEFLEKNPQLKPSFDTLGEYGMPFSYPAETRNFNTQLIDGLETIIFTSNSDLTVSDLLENLQQEFGE